MKAKVSIRLDYDVTAIVKKHCKSDPSKPSIAQKANELIRSVESKTYVEPQQQRQIVVGSRKAFRESGRDLRDSINVTDFMSSCGFRYQEGGSIKQDFIALRDANDEAVKNLQMHGFSLTI